MFSDTTDEAVNLVSSRTMAVKPEPFFTSPVKPEPVDQYRHNDSYEAYRDDEYRPMEEDYRHEDDDEQLRYTEERLAMTLPGGGSLPHHHSGPTGLHVRTSSQINSGKKDMNPGKFVRHYS